LRNRNIIFISYYTYDPIYTKHAKGLIESLNTFNLQHDIESVESDPTKTWLYNVTYKPKYILKKMNQYSCPVVWLDADARIRLFPKLLFECNQDIAFYSYYPQETLIGKKKGEISKIRTGTLFLNNTYVVKKFVEQWIVICEEQKYHDGIYFNKLFKQNKYNMDIQILPVTYCYIFDIDKRRDKSRPKKLIHSPVIEHLQASRSRKRIDRLRIESQQQV